MKNPVGLQVTGLAVWLLGLLFYVHPRAYDAPTPFSRLALLHALVQDRTLAIDRWHARTPDKAFANGHYYSDKAPGTAALALPAFAAAAGALRWAGVELDSEAGWLITSWAACVGSQALPAALGAAALFVWLGRFVSGRAALVTVLGLTLGSLPLPYSTLLFSHAQVIGLIGIALWAVGVLEEGGRAPPAGSPPGGGRGIPPRRLGLAGFCLGLALASEYTAGIVVVALGLYVVIREWRAGKGGRSGVSDGGFEGLPGSAGASPHRKLFRRSRLVPRPLLWFFLAAVPPLLLIPAYSWATIGTPFDLPYSYQASFPEMKEGLYAIKGPDLENLGRLLIGPTRGLVFWTPFLVMAGLGWWWMAKERPRWLWLTYAVPVVHALVISGRTWDWQAGPTLSARYLAPILPLLALPCAIGVQRWPRLGLGLAAVSIGLMSLATVTDASPAYHLYNPLTQWVLPKFWRGEFSPNLGTVLLGLSPGLGVALYYTMLVAGIAWLWRRAGAELPPGSPLCGP